jgi:bifunctional non-homologous end joining protein LigD
MVTGFIAPCLPSKASRPPSGPLWVHEIKHDGYRLMVRRDGDRTRCFTRNGHDWADRFPAIVAAANRIKAMSFLIDGEAVIARDDGTPDFRALRSKHRGHEAVLFAFDLIEHEGADLRDLPLIERKRRLARLIGRAKHAIRFVEHLTDNGPNRSSDRWRRNAPSLYRQSFVRRYVAA